jgi:hypothetical protein
VPLVKAGDQVPPLCAPVPRSGNKSVTSSITHINVELSVPAKGARVTVTTTSLVYVPQAFVNV